MYSKKLLAITEEKQNKQTKKPFQEGGGERGREGGGGEGEGWGTGVGGVGDDND